MVNLKLTKEHAWWLNDILQDYEIMIVTANNTVNELREQWEPLLKDAKTPDEANELAKKLDDLSRDTKHIEVATGRYRELQNVVREFLWIQKPNVDDVNTPTDWEVHDSWEESVHWVDEEIENTSNVWQSDLPTDYSQWPSVPDFPK